MSSAQVMTIISSLNGGHNGEVPGRQIFVEVLSDTEAVYKLVHWDVNTDAPAIPSVIERYALTLVPLPDESIDPEGETGARPPQEDAGLPPELEETQPFDPNTEEQA
ncbi:hypothetical protein SEA_RASPUTIA_76 [Microbacterium phage Rasputia]|nr:hypothetical protein SEA_RASPUTIA_76 [Microbacterium phage Rasputia]